MPFPAEYGNAMSGVFDLNMRTGNNEKTEYAFMFGALGIEAAAEGPIFKGKKASLFNQLSVFYARSFKSNGS